MGGYDHNNMIILKRDYCKIIFSLFRGVGLKKKELTTLIGVKIKRLDIQ